MATIDREIVRLFESFSDGYINAQWEFVVGASGEVSVPLEHVADKWDSAKFLLLFASSEAAYGRPYRNPIRNIFYRQRLQRNINHFCRTSFSRADFYLIAYAIGDCCNMSLAKTFVDNGCKLSVLRRAVDEGEVEAWV